MDRVANFKAAVEGQPVARRHGQGLGLSGRCGRTSTPATRTRSASGELENWFNETYAAREKPKGGRSMTRSARPSPAQMQAACDRFNARYKPGDTITVYTGLIGENPKSAQVRFPAEIMGGHSGRLRHRLSRLHHSDAYGGGGSSLNGLKIEWTEVTWNPIVGCSIVSPGCTNCYAMKMAARLEAMGVAQYAGLTQKSKAGRLDRRGHGGAAPHHDCAAALAEAARDLRQQHVGPVPPVDPVLDRRSGARRRRR